MANGQCMVFERERFLQRDGFGPVRGHVVEDVALARDLGGRGLRVEFLDASELLTVRMYESLPDTWRGWGRSIALPGVEPGWRQLVDVAALAITLVLPIPRLIARRGDVLDVVLVLMRLGTLVGARRAYLRNDVAYWLSPLADAPAVAAVALGALRRRRTWRGRTYR
jgi:dolichol-phosphate mannosyltransferase